MLELTRRDLLARAAAGAAAGLAGCAAPLPARMDTLGRVPLGRTGLRVPPLAMGNGTHGWKRASDQTRLGPEGFARLMGAGAERGAAFVDAADLYGSHPFVRQAFARGSLRRGETVLLSKVWFAPAPEMTPTATARPEVERFLRELGAERLDICLIHCVQDPLWPDQLKRMRDDLAELKARGLVGAVGCSCHTHAALAAAAADPWTDVILARVNPYRKNTDPDAGVPETAAALRAARAAGKGVIGMKIFGCGALAGAQERRSSLEFVFRNGLVDAVTIGFTAPAQVAEVMEILPGLLRA